MILFVGYGLVNQAPIIRVSYIGHDEEEPRVATSFEAIQIQCDVIMQSVVCPRISNGKVNDFIANNTYF